MLENVKRRAAIATGNFGKIFGNLDIEPLPEAALRVSTMCADDDADFGDIARVVEADVGLSATILKLANSAVYGRTVRAASVEEAVHALGFSPLQNLALGWAAMQAVSIPKKPDVDLSGFWTAALLRALLARRLASHICPRADGVAFTGALLADVAIPTLVDKWGDQYSPIIRKWRETQRSLMRLEEEAFEWNHAESSAWIARRWSLPDELVCVMGLHHATPRELDELGILHTPVAPVALSFLFEDILAPRPDEMHVFTACLDDRYDLTASEMRDALERVEADIEETASTFGARAVERMSLVDALQASSTPA